jgi:hypothetical protein
MLHLLTVLGRCLCGLWRSAPAPGRSGFSFLSVAEGLELGIDGVALREEFPYRLLPQFLRVLACGHDLCPKLSAGVAPRVKLTCRSLAIFSSIFCVVMYLYQAAVMACALRRVGSGLYLLSYAKAATTSFASSSVETVHAF